MDKEKGLAFINEQVVSSASGVNLNLNVFDVEAFNRSKALLKDELGIAVEEYLEDAAAYIRDIEDGVSERDFNQICRGSHPLKSNSKGFGLAALGQVAEFINLICEREAHDETSLEKIKTLLPQLKNAFDYGEKNLQRAVKGSLG